MSTTAGATATKAKRTPKPKAKAAARAADRKTATALDGEARTKLASVSETARRTADDLRRAGTEALDEARGFAQNAVDRAGRIGRDVYLAGLGAIAAADERGRAIFSDLVREGEKVSSRDLSEPLRQATQPLRQAGERLKSLGEQVETTVERGVQGGLERLGVPSRREIQELSARIEALSAKLEQTNA